MTKLVYIAGPISAPTESGVQANIDRGRDAGLKVWKLGAVAIVPHLNTPGSYLNAGGISVEEIYLGDLVILERCDAMLRLPGWENSRGVGYETAWAQYHQIPIFDSLEELAAWLKTQS